MTDLYDVPSEPNTTTVNRRHLKHERPRFVTRSEIPPSSHQQPGLRGSFGPRTIHGSRSPSVPVHRSGPVSHHQLHPGGGPVLT